MSQFDRPAFPIARAPVAVRRKALIRRAVSSVVMEPVERRVLLASVAGAFFQDINGNGLRDAGEAGLGGWSVFLDANQNGALDGGSVTRDSTDTPKPLPDVRTPPQTSVLNVAGLGTFSDLDVAINITHSYNADLDVFLITPGGTRIELFTDVGGSGDGMNLTLDQEAGANINTASSGVITGRWRPEGNLSTLYGGNANGNWTLEITDDANGDSGTLNSWSLVFGTGERQAVSSGDGTYQFNNVAAGTYDVRQVNQSGWNQTAPGGGFHTILLGTSTNATGIDFGNRQPPGTIRGAVWDDLDSNGLRGAGEPGLSGWTIYLDLNNNAMRDAAEPSTTSGGNGTYEFANLVPGTYTVREILQPGYVQTAPGGASLQRDGDGEGNGPAGNVNDRKYTQTEIVVAFQGDDGLAQLADAIRHSRPLGQMVDLAGSRRMMDVDGNSLVEVRLQNGFDPQKVSEVFAELASVSWAQPNYIYDEFDPREYTPNDPQYGAQYHHVRMQNNLAWDVTLGSPAILVGVTDDGVFTTHPDLAANIWTNPGEVAGNGIDDDSNGYIDDINGWDFSSNDNNPNPTTTGNDHGTHVAGIVAAKTDNGIGVAGTAGNASIVPLRFYGSASWTSTIISNTYRYATDLGLNIVTTSYNVDGFANDNIFAAAVEYMYDGGVMHFNSAGNNNQLNPARQKFDTSFYVASTDSADRKSSFSNYGWGVDISAPGSDILATAVGTGFAPTYEVKSGTSMATPNAAAVAALIWSAHPTWTRDQVAAQLIATADNIDAQNPSQAGLLGGGRVNSFKGVTQSIAPPRLKALAGLPADGADIFTAPTAFTLDVANVFDPATMTLSSLELRGDGLDNVFGTADDNLVPLSVVFGSANSPDYKIATNRLFFTIGGQMGSDRYRFSVLPTATDPFGQAIDGNGDGVGGDAFTRTFTLTGPTNPHVIPLEPGQTRDDVDFGNHDISAPVVVSSGFDFETGQALRVRFSENVQSSLGMADLSLFNQTTGQAVNTSGFSLTYDSATNTARFHVNGILANANYRATFGANGISDLSGNTLDGDGNGSAGGDLVMPFFFLNGDANRDRTVNLTDFGIVRTNFGGTGKIFSQGDFDYDGDVDLGDFAIVRANFGITLPPPDGDGLFGGDDGGDGDDILA